MHICVGSFHAIYLFLVLFRVNEVLTSYSVDKNPTGQSSSTTRQHTVQKNAVFVYLRVVAMAFVREYCVCRAVCAYGLRLLVWVRVCASGRVCTTCVNFRVLQPLF